METESTEQKQNGEITGEQRNNADNSKDNETKKGSEESAKAEEQRQVTANGQNSETSGENHAASEDEKQSAKAEESQPKPSDANQTATADEQQPESSEESQAKTADEQQPKPADENQTATADEQQPPSDEQQTTSSEESQPKPSDEQQPTTADEQQPEVAVKQQTTTAYEQQPTTTDEQLETADEQQSTTADEQQPTTADEQQPTTTDEPVETADEQQPTTADEQQPEVAVKQQTTTAYEQQPTTTDEQLETSDEQQSTTADEQQPTTAAEQQPTTTDEPLETADEQQPTTADEQQPEVADEQHQAATADEQQQPTADERQLEASTENNAVTRSDGDGKIERVLSAPAVVLEEQSPEETMHAPLDDSTGEDGLKEGNSPEGTEEQNMMTSGNERDDYEAIQLEKSLESLVENSPETLFDINESSKSNSMNNEIENIRRNENDDFAVVTAVDNGHDNDRDNSEKIEEGEEEKEEENTANANENDQVDEVKDDALLTENDVDQYEENQMKALEFLKVSVACDDAKQCSNGVEKKKISVVKSETLEADKQSESNVDQTASNVTDFTIKAADPVRYLGATRTTETKDEPYGSEIRLAGRLEATSNRQEVIAMAILDNELFVICKQPCIVIFKYDIGEMMALPDDGMAEPVELAISELVQPRGLAASQAKNYLYITDRHRYNGGRVWRYRYARNSERRREAPAVELDMEPYGVSVSYNELVLITCSHTSFLSSGKVLIFKEYDHGLLIVRTLAIDTFENPRHAVLLPRQNLAEDSKNAGSQLNDEVLVVCHGWNIWDSHGVSLSRVDQRGVRRRYGKRGDGSVEVNQPFSLTVDADGNVFVVDHGNHRISLLSKDLDLIRHLVTGTQHDVCHPRHLCVHSNASGRRMFVGQKDGSVHIFSQD